MPRQCSERSRSYTPQGGTELSPGDLPGRRFSSRWTASSMATWEMIGQESAEAIVVPFHGTKGRTQRREKARQARPLR